MVERGSEGELAALLAQARAVAQPLNRRSQQLADLKAPASGAAEFSAYHTARLAVLVGAEFPLLPPLAAPGGAFQELWQSAPSGATPAAVFEWMSRAARLRERVDRLHSALLFADALGDPALSDFHVVQLPAPAAAVTPEKWVGLDYDLKDGETFPGGRLSLVINRPDPPAATLAGLYIDDWIEVVPGRSEVTGVAFNFDAPQSSPPQAVLLALNPHPGQAWDPNRLADVLLAGRELVRMRLLTPGQVPTDPGLGQLATHLLPALFFAQNEEPNATISMKLVD